MTDRSDTERRLRRIVVDQLGVTEADVQPEVLLVPHHDDHARIIAGGPANLNADSLDVVELVMEAEEEFNIEISDDDAEQLNRATFGELVDFIHARLPAGAES